MMFNAFMNENNILLNTGQYFRNENAIKKQTRLTLSTATWTGLVPKDFPKVKYRARIKSMFIFFH